MREILRESDPIRIGLLVAILREAGIAPIVLDAATSGLLGGGSAVPMRLVVADAEFAEALRVLREAGEMPG